MPRLILAALFFLLIVVTMPVEAPQVTIEQRARAQVVARALAEVGKPYVLGTQGSDTFDCSGLMQYAYSQIGITTTRTTYTQLDALRPIEASDVQAGDMIYFQFIGDQHVGMLADVDGDGRWDMVHAAAPGVGVIVTSDVFSEAFYTGAIIGYRTAF